MEYLIIGVGAVIAGLLVVLNLHECRRRRRLTRAARRAEDERDRRDMQRW